MEIDVREISDTRFEAVISDARGSQVNAIRRVLMKDVPTLAIEDVTVYDNTSGLFDEIVSHRLGLVPVPTEPGDFNFRDECTCGGEGCPNCIVIYTVSKEGPDTVYSGDLEPQSEEFAFPDPDIPIVTLKEEQRLMLEAVASLGTGEEHTKWSPVVAPAFNQYPRILVGRDGDGEEVEVDRLCRHHLDIRGEDLDVEEVDGEDCDLCDRDVADEEIRVLGEPDRYIFRFETDGSLSAREAMKRSLTHLQERLKVVEEHLDELD